MLGFSPCGLCFQLLAIQQRLKPESKLAICGTTEQAAEKLDFAGFVTRARLQPGRKTNKTKVGL